MLVPEILVPGSVDNKQPDRLQGLLDLLERQKIEPIWSQQNWFLKCCHLYPIIIIIEDFIFVFMNYLHNLGTRFWASFVTLNHFHYIQTVYMYS